MLTAMPTNTAVCRTSTLTPSVTIGSSPNEFLDETVADRCDHVSACEDRTAGWRAGVDRLEDFARRRVFHLGQLIARIPAADRLSDERFRVSPRHDDGTKLELAGHRPSELDAPRRAIVPAVEQPDEGSAIQLLPTDQFALQFQERIDIVHPERTDERVHTCVVLPLEESYGPVVWRRVQHPLEGTRPIKSQKLAHAEGEGHVFFERDVRERLEQRVGDSVRRNRDESGVAFLRFVSQCRKQSLFRGDDRPVPRNHVAQSPGAGPEVRSDDLQVVPTNVRDDGQRRADQSFLRNAAELRIDGHAFDHDRLGVLLLCQSHDILLFPQVRGGGRRTFEDGRLPCGIDEDGHLSGRLHDDPESVRSARGADEKTGAGLPAASVDVDPDRDRLEAVRVAPPFSDPEKSDDGPDRADTYDKRSPTPDGD